MGYHICRTRKVTSFLNSAQMKCVDLQENCGIHSARRAWLQPLGARQPSTFPMPSITKWRLTFQNSGYAPTRGRLTVSRPTTIPLGTTLIATISSQLSKTSLPLTLTTPLAHLPRNALTSGHLVLRLPRKGSRNLGGNGKQRHQHLLSPCKLFTRTRKFCFLD